MRPVRILSEAIETMNVRDCGESDICRRRPCANNGVCERISATEYRCMCPSAYTGKNCETEINMCLTQRPCQNGGVCSITSVGYRCDCPLGFMGRDCESGIVIIVNFPLCTIIVKILENKTCEEVKISQVSRVRMSLIIID